MKKIIIILPYFGNFPIYFNLFLKSCESNSTIDWLILTDQRKEDLKVPDNCKWINTTFESIQAKAKDLFGAEPNTPYDLCKYRAGYHKLFANFVEGYDFWGFCDCDLIFGNIRKFVTEDVLANYPKISWRGHLTLFKLDEKINNIFLTELPGYKTFNGCINGTDGINLFDEVGINKIFDKLGIPIYKELPLCDLVIRNYNFICGHGLFDESTNKSQIFRWESGNLYRVFLKGDELGEQEVVYVHFLKRPMQLDNPNICNDDSFLIIPNRFVKDQQLSYKKVLRLSNNRFYWSYWKCRMTPNFLMKKIKESFSKAAALKEVDRYER